MPAAKKPYPKSMTAEQARELIIISGFANVVLLVVILVCILSIGWSLRKSIDKKK